MDESMATSTEATSPSQINESSEQTQAETPESSASTSQAAAAQGATGKRWNLRIRKPRLTETTALADEDDEEEEEEEEEMDEGDIVQEINIKPLRGRPPTTSHAHASTSSAANTSVKKTPAGRRPQQKKREGAELKAPPSKRRQGAAASAGAGATPGGVASGGGAGGGATPSLAVMQMRKESRAYGMFQSVQSGKGALKSVASEWVDAYQQDPERAMMELIQYFVFSCGCKAFITMDMFRAETSDVIRTLTENFAEESGEYPLIVAGPALRKFKSNFVDFINHIIIQCQHSILYDEYMLDTLIIWLVGFTDSQVRAFRHTCTLACVKVLTALIKVANDVSKELDNTQRQVEAERKRQLVTRTEAGQAKLEKLVSKRGDLTRNKNELEETMKGLFSSVFVHRYKDVRPEIRAVCITELGTWLTHYSVKFLADTYLKYIGWMLYDKVGEVRVACLNVLEPLYSDPDTAPHLELFTEKFKSRLLSMRLDMDEHAAVTAISVLCHMQALDLLDAEESLEVCELVFLENRAISHTAGQFAVDYLFSEDFMSRAKQREVPEGCKKPTDGQIKLTELIKFFSEVKIHDHANYFVDSLWDHTEVMQDWEAMTQLLLDDKCGITLSDEEQCVLIEIMSCSVRRASGATPPPGRAKGKVMSNKEKKAIEVATETLSTHFMVTLPDLLSKCGSDPSNAANLVSIPQHFETEIYAENRLQKHLESLLSQLHELTMKHIESSVLEECAQTYKGLLDQEFSLHSTVDVAFRRLLDQLAENFRQYYTECKEQENSLANEENEDCFGVIVASRRLASFYKIVDLSTYKLSVELKELIEAGVSGDCCESILENTITCLRLEIMWRVHALQDTTSPNRDVLKALHSDLIHLFKNCQDLVKFGSGRGQRAAYVTFADLLMVFAKQLRKFPHLASLVYVPDANLQRTLQDYIMDNVLQSDDDEDENEPTSEEEALLMAERLNDRRVLLASFLKMAMFSVIDNKLIAPIWALYIRQYHNFGDLIKLSLNRCREANPTSWYKTVIEALKELFLAHLEETGIGRIDQTSPQWADLKELAKKFTLSLGFDATKVRLPLVGIHREGILFALSRPGDDEDADPYTPPPYLDFLLVLTEFCHRLLYVDRVGENSGVVPFLYKQLPSDLIDKVRRKELRGWEPLAVYRDLTLPQQTRATMQRTNRKRPQKAHDEEVEERPAKSARLNTGASPAASDEAGSEGGTPPPGPAHKKSGGPTTKRRSTAVAAQS